MRMKTIPIFVLIFLMLAGCQTTSPLSGEVTVASTVTSPAPIVTNAETGPLATTTTAPPTPMPALPTELSTPYSTVTPAFTPTPPVFDVIDATNFRNLKQLSEVRVAYDSEFSDWFQLVFKPDTVWCVCSYGTDGIRITDLNTWQVVAELQAEGDWAGELFVSPDSRYLAVFSPWMHQVSVWDITNFQEVITFPYRSVLPLVVYGAFSKDNQYLAAAGCHARGDDYLCLSSTVTVYSLKTGEIVQKLVGYLEEVTGLDFSADNQLLFMSGEGEKIRNADLLVWNLETNRRQFEVSLEGENWFTDLTLSDDGNMLIASTYTEEAYVWNTKTWEKIGEIPIKNYIYYPVFLPSTNTFLFADSQRNLTLASGEEGILATINIGHGDIRRIYISPEGRFLYILYDNGDLQKWGVEH